MQAQYKTTYPPLIDGQWRSPQVTADGVLKVAVVSGGGGGGGDASASNQETQIAAEEAIQAAVESIDDKTAALVSGRVPVDGSGVTQPVLEPLPARTPRQHSVTVPATGGTPVDLGVTASESCDGGWELYVPSSATAILVGLPSAPLRRIEAGESWVIPSTSLSGWYAISTGIASSVVTTGAAS